MKFRRQRRDELGINLTPLIDVVFLLLIFFMVSTSFTTQTQLTVNLPEAEAEPAPKVNKLVLTITRDGQHAVNGKSVGGSQAEIVDALEVLVGSKRDIPLTVAADGDTAHKFVVTVLDIVARAGFTNVTIAAETPTLGNKS